MPKINFMLDGRSVSVEAEDDQPLLYLLRDELVTRPFEIDAILVLNPRRLLTFV